MLTEEKDKIQPRELLAWLEGLVDSNTSTIVFEDWKVFASLIKKTDGIDQFKAWLSGFVRGMKGRLPSEQQVEDMIIRLRDEISRSELMEKIQKLEKEDQDAPKAPSFPYDPWGPALAPCIPMPRYPQPNDWWANPVYGPIRYRITDGTGTADGYWHTLTTNKNDTLPDDFTVSNSIANYNVDFTVDFAVQSSTDMEKALDDRLSEVRKAREE